MLSKILSICFPRIVLAIWLYPFILWVTDHTGTMAGLLICCGALLLPLGTWPMYLLYNKNAAKNDYRPLRSHQIPPVLYLFVILFSFIPLALLLGQGTGVILNFFFFGGVVHFIHAMTLTEDGICLAPLEKEEDGEFLFVRIKHGRLEIVPDMTWDKKYFYPRTMRYVYSAENETNRRDHEWPFFIVLLASLLVFPLGLAFMVFPTLP